MLALHHRLAIAGVVTAPIVGVTRPTHLSDAIAAVEVELDPDEAAYLEEPYVPHAVAGFQ